MDTSHFIAGTTGGMGGVIVGHPFDTIRVKMQTQQLYNTYRNPLHCCLKVLKSDGIRKGLYKGALSPLIGNTIFKTVNFGVYGNLLEKLEKTNDYGIIMNSIAAGTISSQVCGLILIPIDRVKILLQTHQHLQSINSVISRLTLSKLLKTGFTSTMARESMFGMTYFPLYQTTKWIVQNATPESDNSFIVSAISGGITGSLSWSIVFPFDVVKSKIQSELVEHNTFIDTVKNHYRKEGVKGFYKGWRAAVYRAFPTHATVLGLYQLTINRLR